MSNYEAPSDAINAALNYAGPFSAAVTEACRIALIAELSAVEDTLLTMRETGGIGSAIDLVQDRIAELGD